MKSIFKLLIIAILFSSCQEQKKMGFVNNGDVLNEFQMKKDIEETYKVRNEVFQKRMDSIENEFQVEVKAFQMAQSRMSQKKAQEKYNELGQRNQILTQQFQKDQQVLQMGFTKEMDSVVKKMNAFVKEYGKANGYAYIFGQNEAGSVIYGEEASDLTKTITDALNAEYNTEEETTEEEK
ncbi:MAG: OmpH family outer membrane protein [Winogradskyella sp.]|nr:OmpH family outer membrane protein [Winogradskyella sp.]